MSQNRYTAYPNARKNIYFSFTICFIHIISFVEREGEWETKREREYLKLTKLKTLTHFYPTNDYVFTIFHAHTRKKSLCIISFHFVSIVQDTHTKIILIQGISQWTWPTFELYLKANTITFGHPLNNGRQSKKQKKKKKKETKKKY